MFVPSIVRRLRLPLLLLTAFAVLPAVAQNDIRPVPPPGIALSATERAELEALLVPLTAEIARLQTDLKSKPALLRFLPDVRVYEKAVRYALTYNEFFHARELATAKELIAAGMERAKALRNGETPWMRQAGPIVLGYVSKIDDSIQPYGLVVPEAGIAGNRTPRRLDVFCHGRGETLTELAFIGERRHSPGEFVPPDSFVLHPYGRYCNANRFAGEVDLFEALADVRRRYAIDENRLVVRGFSMGGASCWQYATHHTDVWAAAAPGAGFSETMEFLRLPSDGPDAPPWYERQLMRWYDSTDYAANLYNLPVVAYNGDRDGQKQAADRMADALRAEGLTLARVTGRNTGHSYSADAKKEIDDRLAAFAEKGRDPLPSSLRFTTWTLRYPRMHWLTVTGLKKHWERARVNGRIAGDQVTLTTENVTGFSLAPAVARKTVAVDGQRFPGLGGVGITGSALSPVAFIRTGSTWTIDDGARKGLRKKHGLQGPIDDAFMDRFLLVRPTGRPLAEATGNWVARELERARTAWRTQFRGDAPIKDDSTVTRDDIRNANLILWGDPSSNRVLARLAGRLPVSWERDGTLRVRGKSYPAGTTVPILIFPNPENPSRYLVLNSGITWREEAYLNNARQRPRLPDWAVIDITTPPDKTRPGRIADAGFFDEEWRFAPAEDRATTP
ncbi:MAG: prolyl oligopeptidase family serine peptidase [Capsulimonadales bacterium]|nr:prolyl oligopeptidase family serine peptidase [Capsulimonadales bacterium]